MLQLRQTAPITREKKGSRALHTTPVLAGPAAVTPCEFEQLLIPLLDSAYGVALHMTRDRSTAEDLVQDAAFLAFRAFATFEQGSNFKAWFFRILTNAFYGKYRREKHERRDVSMDDAAPLYLYTRIRGLGLPANDADPAQLLLDRIDRDCVAEALDALPTEYRVVASLYFMRICHTVRSPRLSGVRWGPSGLGYIALGGCFNGHCGEQLRNGASYRL